MLEQWVLVAIVLALFNQKYLAKWKKYHLASLECWKQTSAQLRPPIQCLVSAMHGRDDSDCPVQPESYLIKNADENFPPSDVLNARWMRLEIRENLGIVRNAVNAEIVKGKVKALLRRPEMAAQQMPRKHVPVDDRFQQTTEKCGLKLALKMVFSNPKLETMVPS